MFIIFLVWQSCQIAHKIRSRVDAAASTYCCVDASLPKLHRKFHHQFRRVCDAVAAAATDAVAKVGSITELWLLWQY